MQWKLIENKRPIIQPFGVNAEGPIDMYYKGGNMLNMIRRIVDNDEKWRKILRGMNRFYYHQTVDGTQIEMYMLKMSGKKLQKVFDQYLRHTEIPVLEYAVKNGQLRYRWTNCIAGFDMPVKVALKPGTFTFIYPSTTWKTVKCTLPEGAAVAVDQNFYIGVKRDE